MKTDRVRSAPGPVGKGIGVPREGIVDGLFDLFICELRPPGRRLKDHATIGQTGVSRPRPVFGAEDLEAVVIPRIWATMEPGAIISSVSARRLSEARRTAAMLRIAT